MSEHTGHTACFGYLPTKVWRGCGWLGVPAYMRVAKRWSASAETALNEVGFRIARTPAPVE